MNCIESIGRVCHTAIRKQLRGETTRGGGGWVGGNNSGQKGKWAKRLGRERENGRNDPDSATIDGRVHNHQSCDWNKKK